MTKTEDIKQKSDRSGLQITDPFMAMFYRFLA